MHRPVAMLTRASIQAHRLAQFGGRLARLHLRQNECYGDHSESAPDKGEAAMQCSRLLATIILGTALGAALTTAPLQAADTAHAAGEGRTMEFVRVSDDGWNFEKQPSGERFVPFGANLIFNYRLHRGQGLHILTQEEWDPDAIRAVFAGAAALHMNVLKVFMTSSGVLTDPPGRPESTSV
jgi:hypothetical protein